MREKVIVLSILALFGVAVFYYIGMPDTIEEVSTPEVSFDELREADSEPSVEARPVVESGPKPEPEPDPEPQAAPATAINLAVPFTVQSPRQDWVDPLAEGCEEASVYMVERYYAGERGQLDADAAEEELLRLTDLSRELHGVWLDTTAEETVQFANAAYDSVEFRTVLNPTLNEIKAELRAGRPVIVPAAGRELNNPFFSGEGPLYHMLVLRGFEDEHFITNDPGTRRGEQFLYTYETIMNAAGDWNHGDPANGASVFIFSRPLDAR